MKKVLLVLTLVFVNFGFSQIKVSESLNSEEIGKVQFINLTKTGNIYVIAYKDIKFMQVNEVKSFGFENLNNDLDSLYNMIMSGFDNMPTDDIKLELPNDVVWLHFEKNLGVVSFQFIHEVNKNNKVVGYSRYLNKNQVMKLFGKK